MNRILKTTALAAGLMCGVFATQAQAETITIKVHHFLNANSVQHTKMLRGWCDNIAKDSANRLQCQIFPSMQLGGTPAQLYDQARDGVADVVWTLPGYTSGRFPRVEVFELPFTMTNAEATSAAAWEYYDKHAKEEFKDTKMLAVHVHGPGNIFTAKKQIKTLADIKGLKLRAPTRLTTKLLASLGARIVINDNGSALDGSGADTSVAQQAVDQIKADKAAARTAPKQGRPDFDWAAFGWFDLHHKAITGETVSREITAHSGVAVAETPTMQSFPGCARFAAARESVSGRIPYRGAGALPQRFRISGLFPSQPSPLGDSSALTIAGYMSGRFISVFGKL